MNKVGGDVDDDVDDEVDDDGRLVVGGDQREQWGLVDVMEGRRR